MNRHIFFHWSSCDEVHQIAAHFSQQLFDISFYCHCRVGLDLHYCTLCKHYLVTGFKLSKLQKGAQICACVFLCSRCCWDLRGNVVRMKAAGSLSITLKSSIWSHVLLYSRCFDTWIITHFFQCWCRLKSQADLEVTMPHLSSLVMLHSLSKLAAKVFLRWFRTNLSLCLLQPRLQN